jgi:hypothetical protein
MKLRTSGSKHAATIKSFITHDPGPAPDFGAGAVDVMLDRYVCWREECAAVQQAYRRWSNAARAERQPAYGRYLAAVKREEHAAARYEHQLGWVRRICT